MAVPGREIKQRLRSIKNSKKITKAMELVSAAKMRRSVQAAMASRTYAVLIIDIMQRILASVELQTGDSVYRFFHGQKVEHTTIIMFTSNRGLCGAFNSNVIKKVFSYIQQAGRDHVTVLALGKKGVAALNTVGIKAELAYAKADNARDPSSITEVAAYAYKQYHAGKTDKVVVAYTDYLSAVNQVATIKQLFPIPQQAATISAAINNADRAASLPVAPTSVNYLYEPTTLAVLNFLIPRLADVQIYQALLESNASEHSARMVAMKNATDAASDMIDELVLAFNRARQAVITKEIAEISAGTAAVT